ncbi:MAG: NUDIX hydrolase, partial [Actinobacteria bacterium]|nr:NUDIX hydrolase [Actinomycetota bacterium]
LRGLTSPHDPQARNPDAASVFGDITDAAMKASAQHVLGVSPAQIDAAVAAAGFTPTKAQWLARTLKARRAEIARRAGIPLPDDGVTDTAPDFAAIPDVDVSEPALPTARRISAGIVIVEPDGRLWLIEPKGHYGGYQFTFPKGRIDPNGQSTQQNAHREVWEETGLTATITAYLGDYQGHSGITRYYLGMRKGGTPLPPDPTPYVEGGRETATVRLVTPTEAAGMLNPGRDQRVLAQVQRMLANDDTAGGPGTGGGVAIGPQEPARQAMLPVAADLFNAGEDLEPGRHPGAPRGPPTAWVRLVPARLRPAGAEGVIAFGWKHDELAPNGVVLIFDDVFAEIEAHIAAGRLTADWWAHLLAHEHDFHLAGDQHTGLWHALHAARIAARLLWARALARAARLTQRMRRWLGQPRRLAGAPVAAGWNTAGARKPHGSELAEWYLGWLFTGEEMTPAWRAELADRLERRLAHTHRPEGFSEQADQLHEMVEATIRLLRGQPLGPPWDGVGPVRFHELGDAGSPLLIDPILGLAADAGHVLQDGIREIYAAGEVGVLHEVVESELAPALGFTPAQAHVIAVLAERLVDGPDHEGELWRPRPGWLTARARRELGTLAVRNPTARILLVWDYERTRAGIETKFADRPGWRRLTLRYAEEFHRTAVEEAHLPHLSDAELDREYREAVAGLRQLIASHPNRGYRWSLARALRRRARAERGPNRWAIEVELRHLRERTERAGIWPTDSELVYLAVRNVTWARLTAGRALRELRWWATDALRGTASDDLAPLLRSDYNDEGSGALLRVDPG